MFKIPKEIPENLKFDIKSLEEERANMYSHLLGVIIWCIASPYLLYRAFQLENSYFILAIIIYLISFIMLFSASTLYHSCYKLIPRNRFRVFDHSAIYCFISGSYTPFLIMYVEKPLGYYILFGLWFVTIIGVVFKLFFVARFKVISTVIYLLMGWTAIFIVNSILETMPVNIFYWVAAGGIAYTIGCYFYLNKTLKFTHFYWHLFVLAGAVCHLVAVYKSVFLFL